MIKVSIIVPCYNQSQYLEECLKSVINQTFKNWECIVVNDGGNDDTEKITLNWADQDKRFKYVYKENGGLSSARNAGIKDALGELILPLDADDIINSKYVELAVKEFNKNENIAILYCKAEKFGQVNGEWLLPEFSMTSFLVYNCIFCSGFFRKEDWEKVGGYDENMKYGLEDWEFWINLLKQTQKEVLCVDYVGFRYRVKENSMVKELGKSYEKKYEMLNYIYSKHLELYNDYFPPVIKILQLNESLQNDNKALLSKTSVIKKTLVYKIINKLMLKIK